MKRAGIATIAICLAITTPPFARAQQSPYYVTSAQLDVYETHVYQHGERIWTYRWARADESAIYVDGDVVRQASVNGAGYVTEYDLRGIPTGITYEFDGRRTLDAGFDGQWVYQVSGLSDQYVARYDRGYQFVQDMFYLGNDGSFRAITFDGANNTIWVGNSNTGQVVQWNMNGTIRSSFTLPHMVWALAWDPIDDTLWMSAWGLGTIAQYSKTGTLLQSHQFGSLAYHGGEMAHTSHIGYRLSLAGSCPGAVVLSWADGTPGRLQALLIADERRNTSIPFGFPCAGTRIGISVRLRIVDPPGYFGNQGGSGSIAGTLPPSMCARYLQLIEGGTCQTSNVIRIEP